MKQNVMKRTLAGVLAVLTVAAYMPANVGGFLTESTGIVMGVSAEEATSVSTAEELKNAVEAGGAVQLTANIDLTKTLNVTKDVTIDLKGHNITATDTRAFHVKSGTLTLTGNGTVSSEHTADNTSFGSSSSVIRVGDNELSGQANLLVGSDVTVSSAWCYGVSVFGNKTTETVDVYGKVKVTGVQSAISGNGSAGYGGTTINIYPGAEVTATSDYAIYHPQAGALNITGGTISGLGGIEAKAGTAAISIKGSDTSIIATAEETSHKANGNGTSTRGYAIAAVENAGYAGSPQINVSGGNIVGPVELVKDNAVADEKKGAISITGGRFSTDVSAYVAQGYEVYQSGNSYTVSTEAVASIGEVRYPSLQAAIDAAQAGDTIELKKDVELSKTIVITKDVTINSKSVKYINATDVRAFWVKSGKLTLAGMCKVSSNGDNLDPDSSVIRVGSNDVAAGSTAGLLIKDEGVTVSSNKCYGVTVFGNKTIETVDVYGAIFADGGRSAISGNGSTGYGDTTINIYSGANISSGTGDVAIYHPQAGTLNITGGSIKGKSAVEAKAGTVKISGAPKLIAYGAIKDPTNNKNGSSTSGYAVAAVENDAYTGSVKVNISGGEFSNYPVGILVDNEVPAEKKASVSITGGTFSTDVSAYVADGYYLIDNNPNYTVKKDERVDLSKAKIVVNGGKAYSSSNPPSDITSDIKVTIGDDVLDAGEDYEIYEGDTSAYDIGTYVFKIRGLGNYKGTATANWTISSIVNITVFNGETSDYFKSCQYGKSVTVTPPSGITWDKNSYWEVDTGTGTWEIVSYSQNYSFIALKNVNLRVGHKEEEVSEKSVLTMSTSQAKYSGKDAIKFTFNRSIDDKYTVKEVGILYGTNKLVGANTSISDYAYRDFTNNDTGVEYGVPDLAEALKTRSTVKKGVASSKSKNGTYEFSCAVGTNHTGYVNAIGYVKVYDPSTKKDNILYTNVVADCYDSALYSNN